MKIPRYTVFIVIVSVLSGLWCEWVIAYTAGGIAVVPSVALITMIIVFSVVPLWAGLILAVTAGFFLDSIALPPFGVTMLLLLFLASMTYVLKTIIVDRDSYRMKGILCIALILVAILARPFIEIIAGHIYLL